MTLEPQYVVNMKDPSPKAACLRGSSQEDTRWLAESALAELLPFSTKSDPFFVAAWSHRELPKWGLRCYPRERRPALRTR